MVESARDREVVEDFVLLNFRVAGTRPRSLSHFEIDPKWKFVAFLSQDSKEREAALEYFRILDKKVKVIEENVLDGLDLLWKRSQWVRQSIRHILQDEGNVELLAPRFRAAFCSPVSTRIVENGFNRAFKDRKKRNYAAQIHKTFRCYAPCAGHGQARRS